MNMRVLTSDIGRDGAVGRMNLVSAISCWQYIRTRDVGWDNADENIIYKHWHHGSPAVCGVSKSVKP
jgi:hypothetical protein